MVRRNEDDLQSVAPDSGFQGLAHKVRIAAHDVVYLVYYRGSSSKAAANNAQPIKRLLSALDGQNILFDNEALAQLVSTVP